MCLQALCCESPRARPRVPEHLRPPDARRAARGGRAVGTGFRFHSQRGRGCSSFLQACDPLPAKQGVSGGNAACETGMGALGQSAFPLSRGKGQVQIPSMLLRIIWVSQGLNTCPEGWRWFSSEMPPERSWISPKRHQPSDQGSSPHHHHHHRMCAHMGTQRKLQNREQTFGGHLPVSCPQVVPGEVLHLTPTPRLGLSHWKKQTLFEAWTAHPTVAGSKLSFLSAAPTPSSLGLW